MAYLGTKPANQVIDSTLIADGTVTPADLSTGKPVWDTSGNVGIGTSSPTAKLHVSGTTRLIGDVVTASDNTGALNLYGGGAYNTGSGIVLTGQSNANPNLISFYNGNFVERMRITSDGSLLVGTTSTPSASVYGSAFIAATESRRVLFLAGSATAESNRVEFYNPNGQVGRIATNGSSTSYVTSSDYRLKENIAPMTGALAKVAQLKPCTYTWKADGSAGEGFIAHELQAVCPDAVTGEKDAVNEDGSIKPQGVDTSFLVATLTAAIQEQQQIINDLKARIELLETKE